MCSKHNSYYIYMYLYPIINCPCRPTPFFLLPLRAAELGVHSLLDQAQSRGDEQPVASAGTGLHKPRIASYTSYSSFSCEYMHVYAYMCMYMCIHVLYTVHVE